MIPLCRPLLPTADALLPYLREIDASRQYTNFGPLSKRLEERLAEKYGSPVVVLNNGTTALTAALLACKPKHKRVLVPAWTFVASAAAIVAAGMEPYFVDVDPQTWQMTTETASTYITQHSEPPGAIMPVSPFGSPVKVQLWDTWSNGWRVPVIIDAAAGFDSLRPGRSPAMVSLHATKVLGAGEGGFILSDSGALLDRIHDIQNYGGAGSTPGMNGKLSEYHAAVALAALDGWEMRRDTLSFISARYARPLMEKPWVRMVPGFNDGWVSSYCTVLLEGGVGPTQARLAARGIESRRWWGEGVHTHPAFRLYPHDDLPVTADLASRCLSLPFSPDMTDDEIERVCDAL